MYTRVHTQTQIEHNKPSLTNSTHLLLAVHTVHVYVHVYLCTYTCTLVLVYPRLLLVPAREGDHRGRVSPPRHSSASRRCASAPRRAARTEPRAIGIESRARVAGPAHSPRGKRMVQWGGTRVSPEATGTWEGREAERGRLGRLRRGGCGRVAPTLKLVRRKPYPACRSSRRR